MTDNSERFAATNVTPFRFDDPERHATAMREATETLIFTADDGQQFSGLHLNRDFTTQPSILSLNAMFTGSNSTEQAYAAYQLAAAFPDHSVVEIDPPAHGHSDPLTEGQFKEIITSRGLSQIARAQAEALRRRLPSTRQQIINGSSMGARLGFDFAREAASLDMEPIMLTGFDPVGLEQRTTASVTAAYFVPEVIKTRFLYRDTPQNHHLNLAFEVFKSQLTEQGYRDDFSMPAVLKNDPRILLFLAARSPLAARTGAESLEHALEELPGLTANLVVGGLSSICRWRKIAPLVGRLQTTFPGRLGVDIWPHDSHGMAFAPQQPRLAAYAKAKAEEQHQTQNMVDTGDGSC